MDILNENQWLMMLVVVTALLVVYFFYLCFTTRVLACFGRRALDSSSISYLFLLGCVPALYLLGCVPALYLFTLLEGPKMLNITNATVAVFLLLVSTLSAKTLMQWLAQGIRVPFQVEADD